MIFKNLLFVSLLLFSITSQAQITGRITDSTGHSIQFCNAILIKSADSAIVTGTTTDSSGRFQMKTNSIGNFRLLTYSIGYSKSYSSVFNLSQAGQSYNSGVIRLSNDVHSLATVSVTANKPLIEQQIDRTVFNIDNNVIFSGSNALEILKKLPEVSVDNNDIIKVASKPGILVMIDGKNTYMSSADLAQYLKSLDASQVEKIELITNPSSKYDASGKAIINIVLKKDKNLGFNGRLYLIYNQGIKENMFAGMNFNYKTKKWNFFGGFGARQAHNFSYQDVTKTFSATDGSPQQLFIGNSAPFSLVQNYNIRAGIDFTPNDKQTLSLTYRSGAGKYTGSNNSNTNIFGPNSVLDSSLSQVGNQTGNWFYADVNLSYDYKIDTNGKELTANIDYSPFSNGATEQDMDYFYNNTGNYLHTPTLLSYSLPISGTVWAGQADFSNPIGKDNKLEFGVKGSFINTDNNAQYWDVINNESVTDTTKSNRFLYTENVFAGYLNFYHKLSKKVDVQLGLRGEESQISGTQYVHDTSFASNYFNIFPSAFFTWRLDKNNTFNFSYSRRIDRPDYDNLNPFKNYVDPYTYTSGNINLLPTYVDNFEVRYNYKTWLNTSLRYSYYVNFITPLYFQDSTGISYSQPSNIGFFDEVDLSTTVTIPFAQWLTTMVTNDIYYNKFIGAFNGVIYDNSGYIWIPSVINNFTFKRGWSAEIDFMYTSRNLSGPTVIEPFYNVDAGIRKQFAGNRCSVSLNFSDIFWSNKTTTIYSYQNVNLKELDYFDDQRVRLSISWKLGQSKYERENQKRAADEQLGKVQKGNN